MAGIRTVWDSRTPTIDGAMTNILIDQARIVFRPGDVAQSPSTGSALETVGIAISATASRSVEIRSTSIENAPTVGLRLGNAEAGNGPAVATRRDRNIRRGIEQIEIRGVRIIGAGCDALAPAGYRTALRIEGATKGVDLTGLQIEDPQRCGVRSTWISPSSRDGVFGASAIFFDPGAKRLRAHLYFF